MTKDAPASVSMADPPPGGTSEPVTLRRPIGAGAQAIEAITLRRPSVGELRGLKLTDIVQMDIDAMRALLPRISDPHLTASQIDALDLVDFTELAGRAALFFVDAPSRQAAGSRN